MKKISSTDISLAVSAYFLVGIVWYLIDKKRHNAFTTFHVKQAINYTIFSYLIYAIAIAVGLWVIFPTGILYTNPLLAILILLLLGILVTISFCLFVIQSHVIFEEKKEPVLFIGNLADVYLRFK